MSEPTPNCFVVAEAGVNHNGSRETALALVAAAAKAGADAVKFQTFKAERLAAVNAPKADYQIRTTGAAGDQLAMLKALELSDADHAAIIASCAEHGIEFMSTPFDIESARYLIDTARVRRLKVASGEITDGPLLLELARSHKPIILSTGMATLEEVKHALGVIAFGYVTPPDAVPSLRAFREAFRSKAAKAALADKVTILHCTSAYPAPADSINLRAMTTLAREFHLPVGLSDHYEGTAISIAAVGLGASVIEKHFTLDKSAPGPDHKASLTVAELEFMIAAIRTVTPALGDGVKSPQVIELRTRTVARKSLVALAPIAVGENFTVQNLGAKRPGGGVSPMMLWSYLGKPATRAYGADEMIDPTVTTP